MDPIKKLKSRLLFAFLLIFATSAMANVKLPYVLSSNMVLQRDTETAVWGWADSGEKVEVAFRGEKIKTVASNDGTWKVKLKTGIAGGPFELTVKGNNEIKLENILVGDVWVCSGQSNMAFTLIESQTGITELASAKNPNIRLLQVPNNASPKPEDNVFPTQWEVCSSETASDFSAVGYFFGKKIQAEIGIPIGLISSNWGGTKIETWISQEAADTDGIMGEWLNDLKNLDLEEMAKEQVRIFKLYHKQLEVVMASDFNHEYLSSDFNDANWISLSQPNLWESVKGLERFNGIMWYRKSVDVPQGFDNNKATLSIARIDDSDITWFNGKKVGETYNKYNVVRTYKIPSNILNKGKNQLTVRVEDYTGGGGFHGDASEMFLSDGKIKIDLSGDWKMIKDETPTPQNPEGLGEAVLMPNQFPTLLFNGMINPLLNFAIKGAIWYQGESNADSFSEAFRYENQMRLMIADWRKNWDNENLSFYMVQLANYKAVTETPKNEVWPYLREAQANVANDQNVEMACIIDIGNAENIHPRNKVDVGSRLALKALKNNYGKDIISNGPRYDNVELKANKAIVSFDLQGADIEVKSKDGGINGFAVAGADKVFHYAQAKLIADNKIEVSCDKVNEIVALRYLWADNPGEINLYNSVGLPSEPFRTDNWK